MIVVTGGAGFIGSNLLAGLEEAGHGDLVVCHPVEIPRLRFGEGFHYVDRMQVFRFEEVLGRRHLAVPFCSFEPRSSSKAPRSVACTGSGVLRA